MTTEEIASLVCSFILKMGCPNKYIGCQYIREGVTLAVVNDTRIGCLKKYIYPDIAAKYNTDLMNVERCIRTVVVRWWNANRCGGMFSKRPTNSELFYTIADHVRVQQLVEIAMEAKQKRITQQRRQERKSS